jgi:hypothetical protein
VLGMGARILTQVVSSLVPASRLPAIACSGSVLCIMCEWVPFKLCCVVLCYGWVLQGMMLSVVACCAVLLV